jgi:hypothetical protein
VGFLAGWWMWLSCARLVPVPVGQGSSHSTWIWGPAGPDGWRESEVMTIPRVARARQGLKCGGLGGGRYLGELWTRSRLGPSGGLVAGILVVMDSVARPRGGYSSVVWFWRLEAGAAEGQVSCHVWVWYRVVAWCSPRGGEPGRMEQ